MNVHRDPDRLINAFLMEGATELADEVYDTVRDRIDHTRQRAVIGPWRMPDIMNKLVPIGLGAAVVVVALVIGTQLLRTPASGGTGGAPSAAPSAEPSPTLVGGSVTYQLDGAPATTEVDAVAVGGSVSGTAVTTFALGTHTVQLKCAADYGDTWALGGKVEQSTADVGSAGTWSAVIVKDGSPQQIGINISDGEWQGSDCDAWLASTDYSRIDPSNFNPVESGALVAPPDPAP